MKVPDLENLGDDQIGVPFQLSEQEQEQEQEQEGESEDEDEEGEQVGQIGEGEQEEQQLLLEEEQVEGLQENELQTKVVVGKIASL